MFGLVWVQRGAGVWASRQPRWRLLSRDAQGCESAGPPRHAAGAAASATASIPSRVAERGPLRCTGSRMGHAASGPHSLWA